MRDDAKLIVGGIFVLFLVLGGIGGGCYGWPKYKVWQQGLAGEAKLREAEYSKQVAVEEAKALQQSAKMKAEAEVERAKGVAEANRIIGDSLAGNEAYLRYLWIQGLSDGNSETIYVPTEANLPILEASRKAPRPEMAVPSE